MSGTVFAGKSAYHDDAGMSMSHTIVHCPMNPPG